jgi:hypothetical protein
MTDDAARHERPAKASASSATAILAIIGLAAFGLGGCVATNVVRTGEIKPPKAANCPIRFERTSPERAAARYERVGAICANLTDSAIYRSGDLADWARSSLVADACGLGGEMVTVIGSCSINRVDGTEFGVFVERRPDAAAVAHLE